jgi:hypothetical protein
MCKVRMSKSSTCSSCLVLHFGWHVRCDLESHQCCSYVLDGVKYRALSDLQSPTVYTQNYLISVFSSWSQIVVISFMAKLYSLKPPCLESNCMYSAHMTFIDVIYCTWNMLFISFVRWKQATFIENVRRNRPCNYSVLCNEIFDILAPRNLTSTCYLSNKSFCTFN